MFASALLLILSASATAADTTNSFPPRISFQHLRSASTHDQDDDIINLHKLLHNSNGILRIALDDNNNPFVNLRKRALRSLCSCPTFTSSTKFDEATHSHPKDVQQIILPDGSIRRTLGSATIGFDNDDDNDNSDAQPAFTLELPLWVQNSCGSDAYNTFEELRDAVANVVNTFVQKLDYEQKISPNTNMNNSNMGSSSSSQTYRQILSDANHLEHFHVYTKESDNQLIVEHSNGNNSRGKGLGSATDMTSSTSTTTTLDYHTDAGFFLSFVPAMNCHTETIDNTSFLIKGHDEPIKFEEDEVIIMMGAGAQYWLPTQHEEHPFLATSHALRLLSDTHRSWYGKMHLLPTSLTAGNPALSSFQLEDYDAHVPSSPVDGCGTNTNDIFTEMASNTAVQKQSRRRLQHVNSPANCNNVTNFFCWYQCIKMPDSEQAEQYVYDGYSLYCLDPALLSAGDDPIRDAALPCQGGYVHNSNCQGSWQLTDETVQGYVLPYEVKPKKVEHATNNATTSHNTTSHNHNKATYPAPETGDKYCYGGTSMYMNGFTWQGSACVIYLFQSWVLTTPGKFVLAAIGSILLGIALECVLWKRKSVYAMPSGTRRLCLSALIYGLQLSMGYFIMLVIMTYSGPLFICTVGGMMIGHVIFNAQDSFMKQREKSIVSRRFSDEVNTAYGSTNHTSTNHGGITPVSEGSDLGSSELGSYQKNGVSGLQPFERGGTLRTRNESDRDIPADQVSDGATPCCQYTI